MTTFQVQNEDGTLLSVSHREFYEILNKGDGYLYYKQSGSHLALLPSITNEEILRVCRKEEAVLRNAAIIETRCHDEKGRPCRYQHCKQSRNM